jgi:hypothetical protein
MFAAKNAFIGKGSTGYNIARSVRLRASATAYLSRTPASASNRTTWTWSSWVKFGLLTGSQTLFEAQNGTTFSRILIDGNLNLSCQGGTSNVSTTFNVATSAVIRDPSSWYHFVVAFDTTQATAANRVKLYINGVQVTAFATATYPTQNSTWSWNASCLHNIGRYVDSTFGAGGYADGYLAELNFVDGQALTPSSFGAYNIYGVWQPKQYTGTYGTNGFYLKFDSYATAAALGTDSSGNSNTWTVNNINVTAYSGSPPNNTSYDSMTDVPTLTSATAANYPTWNPLTAGGLVTFSEANLKALSTSNSAPSNIESTMKTSTTGKWYAEVTVAVGANNPAVGIGNNPSTSNSNTDQYAAYRAGGTYITSGMGASSSGTPATYTTNDVIGIAYDVAAGTLVFYKNGTLQTGGFTGITAGSYSFIVRKDSASGDGGFLNCGQRPFSYTPPTGYVALNTYNLSTPTIANGAAYMAATLYTGTGSAQSLVNTVNSVSFQPDWVWVKARSSALSNSLYDVLRGVRATLSSNLANAENVEAAGVSLTAFNSNGFSVGTDNVGYGSVNGNGNTYVAWQWKANGTGVSNTSGSITSTVSAGATQGFSVVTYTGTGANATVGHGLGVAPSMMIIKNRVDGGRDWQVYHINLTSAAYTLQLDLTAAQASNPTQFNSTAPTSSVFSVGTAIATNGSTNTFVAYVFAPVAGYSAFGTYTGNGSADGPFVYLGFKPRWIMLKKTSAVSNWSIVDTSRQNYNVEGPYLNPNLSDAETTGSTFFDMLSNGFKLRASTGVNDSAATYIYAAFAENPFKYSLAR